MHGATGQAPILWAKSVVSSCCWGPPNAASALRRSSKRAVTGPSADEISTTRSTPSRSPVVQKPDTKDNRSGLGDGTNPGNGTGRVNSPNTGTKNPNHAQTTAQLAQAAANTLAALLKTQMPTVQQAAAKSSKSVVRKA